LTRPTVSEKLGPTGHRPARPSEVQPNGLKFVLRLQRASANVVPSRRLPCRRSRRFDLGTDELELVPEPRPERGTAERAVTARDIQEIDPSTEAAPCRAI